MAYATTPASGPAEPSLNQYVAFLNQLNKYQHDNLNQSDALLQAVTDTVRIVALIQKRNGTMNELVV
jgi:hypothetical protein